MIVINTMAIYCTCRHVCLLFDEMKVREGLVFKRDGHVGFVRISDIDDSLKALEAKTKGGESKEVVADHVLTVMVQGIFMKLHFPLASFPTKGINNIHA